MTGERYYLTYLKQETGGSVGGLPILDGVFLHRIREHDSLLGVVGRDSFSAYIPWAPYGFGVGRGVQWVSPTGSLSILITDLEKDTVTVDFSFSPTGSLSDTTGPAWQQEPTVVRVRGKRARITVLSAWDQSGVDGHFVSVNGDQYQPIGLAGGVGSRRTVSVPLPRKRNRVAISARDLAGNTTVWETTITAKRKP